MGPGLLPADAYVSAQQRKRHGQAARTEASRSKCTGRPTVRATMAQRKFCSSQGERKSMRTRYNFAAVLSAVVLLCCGALLLNQNVSAAGEGKITGTVKLDGTAPHMKGIDMSKDPYCVKAHASDPAHLETVVVGSGGGLGNVVLYLSEGLSGSALTEAPAQVPVFDQKNCVYTPHVLALDINQKFKV